MKAWRIEVGYKPEITDPAGTEALLALQEAGLEGIKAIRTLRGTLLPDSLSDEQVAKAAAQLLCDPITEQFTLYSPGTEPPASQSTRVTVIRRPGVKDAVAASTIPALMDLEIPVDKVATYCSYMVEGTVEAQPLHERAKRVLANDVIEEILLDRIPMEFPSPGSATPKARREIPIRGLTEEELTSLSTDGCLSLSLEEMLAIQNHYKEAGREATDAELETIAQTWSEHCKHKTLTARIEYKGKVYDNLLKDTIGRVTNDLDRKWCRSVFVDNAGVVDFDEDNCLAIKVETHNHPSAIEPFGGAGTGIGGVIRDIMGTGLGARPIANLDVFCFAPPDMPKEKRPVGALHPLRALKGVVAGVRDYGNPMGIPTVNGSIAFDDNYAGNCLVYAGSVGIMPRWAVEKEVLPGDIILMAGGQTGRDGIHGATFSSIELTHESEVTSSGAVQIGDPIMEKRLLEGQLRARDRKLYRGVTDCGAGGLSSAVGEMGEEVGARVELSKVPLKYEGLAPWEIWISEAQERMVMAVPPENLDEILKVFSDEEVEATPIGTFGGGRLVLQYEGEEVADLDIHFLHKGVPQFNLVAKEATPSLSPPDLLPSKEVDLGEALCKVLSDPNVASKDWVVRQYDHEVQGGSALKPLCGPRGASPADSAVVAPIPGKPKGFALGHGLQIQVGKINPYAAAALAVDEAMRNVVASGADPDQTCILDNYCWGNPQNPEILGSIVEATLGACDAARVFRTPFVSGKDSLNNEFRTKEGELKAIPGTLLITAMGIVEDVAQAPGSDWKRPGLSLWAIGEVGEGLGGSIYLRTLGQLGDVTPQPDSKRTLKTLEALHRAIRGDLVESVHDISEGGLAVTLAESAFGRGIGAQVSLAKVPRVTTVDRDDHILFAESPGSFVVALTPEKEDQFAALFADLPAARIGETLAEPTLKILGHGAGEPVVFDEPLNRLETAWRKTFDLGHH